MERKLYRLPGEGKIAGVAAGLADYLAVDVTLMRLIFVALAFFSGGAIIFVYIILAIVLPTLDEASGRKYSVEEKVENLATEIKTSGRARRAGNYVGIGLIVFGVWLLIGQLFPVWFSLQWQLLWPLVVILLGVWIIVKGKR